jgi:hypothetical protein
LPQLPPPLPQQLLLQPPLLPLVLVILLPQAVPLPRHLNSSPSSVDGGLAQNGGGNAAPPHLASTGVTGVGAVGGAVGVVVAGESASQVCSRWAGTASQASLSEGGEAGEGVVGGESAACGVLLLPRSHNTPVLNGPGQCFLFFQ